LTTPCVAVVDKGTQVLLFSGVVSKAGSGSGIDGLEHVQRRTAITIDAIFWNLRFIV
jgi:hypothetical protein